jgi:hypothetical protein
MLEPDLQSIIDGLAKRIGDLERSSQIPNSSAVMRVMAQGSTNISMGAGVTEATEIVLYMSLHTAGTITAEDEDWLLHNTPFIYAGFVYSPIGAHEFVPTAVVQYDTAGDPNTVRTNMLWYISSSRVSLAISVIRSQVYATAQGAKTYTVQWFLTREPV